MTMLSLKTCVVLVVLVVAIQAATFRKEDYMIKKIDKGVIKERKARSVSGGLISTDHGDQPSKHDSEYTAFACEEYNLFLSCPVGHRIEVDYANYGRTDLYKCDYIKTDHRSHEPRHRDVNCTRDVTEHIIPKCDGLQRCMTHVQNYEFGDPCQGNYKYLEVDFSCEKAPDNETSLAYACRDRRLTLECPVGQNILVKKATFGRGSNIHRCRYYASENTDPSVNPPPTNCGLNVLDHVGTRCNNQRECGLMVTDHDVGPTPFDDTDCAGMFASEDNYLEVEFDCVTKPIQTP